MATGIAQTPFDERHASPSPETSSTPRAPSRGMAPGTPTSRPVSRGMRYRTSQDGQTSAAVSGIVLAPLEDRHSAPTPMTPTSRTQSRGMPQRASRQGLTVVAMVNNTPACKNALQYAKSLLAGRCSTLILTHCMSTSYNEEGMQNLLSSMASSFAGMPGLMVKTELFRKAENESLPEALSDLVDRIAPDLVIIGSMTCSNARTMPAITRPSPYMAQPAASNFAGKAAVQAFALKLCQAIRKVPVLVVKADSRGRSVVQGLPPLPIRCMVDLQPTSRYMLGWVMSLMDPIHDKLYLAVSRAMEHGMMKTNAARMMTAFNMQASMNQFRPMQRALKDAANFSLPAAVVADKINLLAVQGPRCKDLSPVVVDVLSCSQCSVLIFPPDANGRSSGARLSHAYSDSGSSLAPILPAAVGLRARSISTDVGFGLSSPSPKGPGGIWNGAEPAASWPAQRGPAAKPQWGTERSAGRPFSIW